MSLRPARAPVWACCVLAIIVTPALAESVEQLVAEALANAPELLAAERAVDRARAAARAAGAWPGPRAAVAGVASDERVDWEAELAQPLLTPTRGPARDAALAGVELALLELAGARLAVEAGVRRACVELQAAERRVAATEQDAAAARALTAAAARLVELGERPGIERLRAELESGLADQDLAAAVLTAEQVRSALASLVGRPVQLEAATAVVPALDADPLLALAQSHPLLLAAERGSARNRLEADSIRAERLPEVALAGFREDRENGVRVGLSVPLFDPGIGHRAASADARAGEADAALALAQRDVARRIEQARLTVASTVARRESFTAAVLTPAERLLERAVLGYELGETTQLDALDARRRLADARRRLVDLELELALAVIDLQLAVGRFDLPTAPAVAALGPPVPSRSLQPRGAS